MNDDNHRPIYGIQINGNHHHSMAPRHAHNDKGGHFKDPPANKALDEDWDGDREDREADSKLGRKKIRLFQMSGSKKESTFQLLQMGMALN